MCYNINMLELAFKEEEIWKSLFSFVPPLNPYNKPEKMDLEEWKSLGLQWLTDYYHYIDKKDGEKDGQKCFGYWLYKGIELFDYGNFEEFERDLIAYFYSTLDAHYINDKKETQKNQTMNDVFETLALQDKNLISFYCMGSSYKYISRIGKKEGMNIKDFYKAIHFLLIGIYYKKL